MEALIFCFFLSTIVSGIMVVSALNPVLSIFWLVLVFVNSAVFFSLVRGRLSCLNVFTCLCGGHCCFVFVCSDVIKFNRLSSCF